MTNDLIPHIEIAIYTASYSAGHAIIVDGYNTDDYYHLNFGWGTSNNTCWYLLPQGMPSGYAIIASAVLDIEGGSLPVEVSGGISVEGVSPEGTEIWLEGERYSYNITVDDESGDFTLPALLEGYYNATAMLNDRIHYQYLENIYIDAENNEIQFQLGNFDSVTGEITAPVNVENCQLVFYQDGTPVYAGVTDTGGSFSIPDVLPGTYTVTASMAGNYFAQTEIEVTIDSQEFDLELEHYQGEVAVSYASFPTETWSLVPGYTIGCAVKLGGGDSFAQEGDIISQIRFKSPISNNEGSIQAQLWQDELLIAEQELTDFNYGEWVSVDLENYIKIDPEKNYYAGYTITSETGTIVFHDDTPRVLGHGAFLRYSDWVELQPDNFNFNFCIEAVTGTLEYGEISGSVSLEGGNGNILDVSIKAGNYAAHPDAEGNYVLPLKYGDYDLEAALGGYNEFLIPGLQVNENNQMIEDQDIFLQYGTPSEEEEIVTNDLMLSNYPNPFNPTTTISFKVSNEPNEPRSLIIYNLKGQKIRKYAFPKGQGMHPGKSLGTSDVLPFSTSPVHFLYEVIWDGTDDAGNAVPSGIYFYRLSTGDQQLTRKMTLLK